MDCLFKQSARHSPSNSPGTATRQCPQHPYFPCQYPWQSPQQFWFLWQASGASTQETKPQKFNPMSHSNSTFPCDTFIQQKVLFTRWCSTEWMETGSEAASGVGLMVFFSWRCSCGDAYLETNLASRWEGVWLPQASGKSPNFPRSSLATPRKLSRCGT